MAMTTAHVPVMGFGDETPVPLQDPKIEMLSAMFPDIEKEVVGLVLAHHGGDVEAAVSAMLDVSAPAPVDVSDADAALARSIQDDTDTDAELARRLQAEQDEAVAKAVHEELQRELKVEADARRREMPAQAAANAQKAVTNMSNGAKALLQRLRAGPSAARGGASTSTSTHGVRLLDAAADPSGGYDTAPLSIGAIRSPLDAAYAPPSLGAVTTPTAAPAIGARLGGFGGAAASPPGSGSEAGGDVVATSAMADGAQPSTARYSSRMERARSHNASRARTLPAATPPPAEPAPTVMPLAAEPTARGMTTVAPPAPPAPPAVPVVVVPEGQLI